jgi:TPR repeat protein
MPRENHEELEPSAPAASGPPILSVPVVVVSVLGVVVLLGLTFRSAGGTARDAEVRAVRAEVATKVAARDDYRAHVQNLRWRAGKMHEWAEAQAAEPVKAWARERARLFDGLVAQAERGAEEREFAGRQEEIERLCAAGKAAEARALTARLPAVAFPKPAEFQAMQRAAYFAPLAAAGRRSPEAYRAFRQQEPEAAQEDIAALRAQVAAEGTEAMTPQQMFGLELLGAVLPADDPLLADWTALTAAGDFFENPDGATLADWRKAQQAIRAQDWASAAAHMQSILRTKVRTRQPFRAAYGRVLLKDRPDRKAEALPFMEEAAATGDREARAWVAGEELAQGRYAQALRRFEAGVMEGEAEAVPQVLKLYAMSRTDVPRDAAREAGVLERILTAPDAPPNAGMLLARLYESGEGVPLSAGKAFACYLRAAEKGHVPAWPEVARCNLRGAGTAADAAKALEWAGRAFAAGEREKSVPILIELMERQPERATEAVQEMIEQENVSAGHGYRETRVEVPGESRLRMLLATRLEQLGKLGQAARIYASVGKADPAAAQRHAELTLAHPCETCGGAGKIQVEVPCPTCGGKGGLPCSQCGGRGYSLAPGPPPCTTCAGSGGVMQDGRAVKCSACGGSGRGRDSVTKKACPACTRGQMPCPDCTGGKLKIPKECPECHGAGHWTMADRGGT